MAALRSSRTRRRQARRLVQTMADAWMRADVPAIVELFAPGGIFISPAGAARGHAEIAAAAIAFFGSVERVSVELKRVQVDGTRGLAEWTWRETVRAGSESRTMEDAIVFEVRNGKLTYWREYFDPGQTEPLEP